MSSRRHLAIAVLGLVVGVGVGWIFLVWPVYRKAELVRQQIEQFADCGELTKKAELIQTLDGKISEVEAWMAANQRIRPADPNVAGLVKALSRQPVDGSVIFDRAFNAREPRQAVEGRSHPEMVLPLVVSLEARWSAVFELLQQVEKLDRLVRVAALHVECNRRDANDVGVATATVTLEAVYDPSSGEEVADR